MQRPATKKFKLSGTISFVDLAAYLALILGVVGFLDLEALPLARLTLLGLALLAGFLVLTKRDRVLASLITIYVAVTTLLSLLLNAVLPVWVIFPVITLLTALLLVWLAGRPGQGSNANENWLFGVGGGILLVELVWFLSLWPFDPQSKAAVVALTFYGIWSLKRAQERATKLSSREWLAAGAMLSLILFFVIWFAEWYA